MRVIDQAGAAGRRDEEFLDIGAPGEAPDDAATEVTFHQRLAAPLGRPGRFEGAAGLLAFLGGLPPALAELCRGGAPVACSSLGFRAGGRRCAAAGVRGEVGDELGEGLVAGEAAGVQFGDLLADVGIVAVGGVVGDKGVQQR